MITPSVLREEVAHEQSAASPVRDPLYLFACHLEWQFRGNLRAHSELIAALYDCDEEIRRVAKTLLTAGRAA